MAEQLIVWDVDPAEPGDVTALDRRLSDASHYGAGCTDAEADLHSRMFCALAAIAYSRPPRDHRRNIKFGRAPVRLLNWQRLPQRRDHVRHVALGLPEPAAQPSAPHGPPALSDGIVGGLS